MPTRKIGDPTIITIETGANYVPPHPIMNGVLPPLPGKTYFARLYPVKMDITVGAVRNLCGISSDENWLDLLFEKGMEKIPVDKTVAVVRFEKGDHMPLITTAAKIPTEQKTSTGFLNLALRDTIGQQYLIATFNEP